MGTTNDTGLPRDWVVRPAIDLELKQYMLLGYLQRVGGRFAERKLYPHLEDLGAHIAELLRLRRGKDELARAIPRVLLGFDPRTGAPVYEGLEEDATLGVVDEVIDFALPGLRRMLEDGQGLREEIAGSIRFAPLGVQPLNATEGWLLLRIGREARAYGYAMPLLREADEERQYRSVHTRYVASYTVGIACTFEHIKTDLIRRHKSVPVPATFVLEADIVLPHIETFMPLAKQLVYEHIAKRA